jgi:protein-S-isoprenylcysteine O-methyltransferase Ste14
MSQMGHGRWSGQGAPRVRSISNPHRTKAGPTKEKRTAQKIIVSLALIPTVGAFIVPALDHRFGWSNLPLWLTLGGDLLILAGMWMVYRVFKENSYGSATVGVTKDQKVISTGPYAIVRNPMYTSGSYTLSDCRSRSVPIGG